MEGQKMSSDCNSNKRMEMLDKMKTTAGELGGEDSQE